MTILDIHSSHTIAFRGASWACSSCRRRYTPAAHRGDGGIFDRGLLTPCDHVPQSITPATAGLTPEPRTGSDAIVGPAT